MCHPQKDMESLNYQHLYYFWMILRHEGVAPAARHLRLSHSTLSTQLKQLEQFLGGELFQRGGRSLVPTPLGLQVAAYAEEIFRIGHELLDVARGQAGSSRSVFRVGIVSGLPKTVAYRLVEPALKVAPETLVQLRQDNQARLLEELATGRLHVVLADTPPQASAFRLHAHVLGESSVLLYGTAKLVRKYGGAFPESLQGAPFVLPLGGALRRALDRFFADRGIHVRVLAEIDDAGMLRVFGGNGVGIFPVREALKTEVEEAHRAHCLGPVEGVRERYYAISPERRIRHPAVGALVETARATLRSVPSA
ncbi:MAG: LysR family transcriptional regulator [Polyangiaceae bacterium]|nr:LysR family transcriptional regulator [Polyangiaceae bacterium]